MERVRGNHLSSRTRPTRGCDSSRYLAHWAPPAPPAPLSALWMQRGAAPAGGGGSRLHFQAQAWDTQPPATDEFSGDPSN